MYVQHMRMASVANQLTIEMELLYMINEYFVKKYCNEDISLIENYDKAVVDKEQTWDCHHRRESETSKKELIKLGEYYNRPASELIFLTKSEHRALHLKGKHHNEETKKKLSISCSTPVDMLDLED